MLLYFNIKMFFTRIMMSLRKTKREFLIKAPWGNIKASTLGDSNNPPVVVGTGRQMPYSSIHPLILKLPQNYFYITFDLPGNGTSDHLPKGVRYTVFDLIPSLLKVSNHFKCENFIYIGHSLGTIIGRMTRIVELDPIPSYQSTLPEEMSEWYQDIYGSYYEDSRYKIYTSSIDTAPKYSYEEVKKLLVMAECFTDSDENIDYVKEGYVRRGEDGLYRFNHDQRMKSSFTLPFPPDYLRELYTRCATPIFTIFASDIIDNGTYRSTPFAFDETAWPNGNYRFKIVKGGHNVHILDPDCMAKDISEFMLEEVKAKLECF